MFVGELYKKNNDKIKRAGTALLDIANIFSGDEKIISYHFKVNRDIVKHLIGQNENSDGFFGVAESECNNIIDVFEARADKLSSSICAK